MMDILKLATIFYKLAKRTDIVLEVERAFPPDVYPPHMVETDKAGTYYGVIDDDYALEIDTSDSDITMAYLRDLKSGDIVFNSLTLKSAINHYLKLKAEKKEKTR